MVFDDRWDEIFSNRQWGKYPNEEAVRFVFRKLINSSNTPRPADAKVLDLGCGAGSNLWMLCKEGFQTFGIDGSFAAVKQAKTYLAKLNLGADIRVGDISLLPFNSNEFWGVLDISAIQHNSYSGIVDIYSEIKRVLKKGGYFFSFCLSDDTTITDYREILEPGTYDSPVPIGDGVLIHFFSKTEIHDLWGDVGPLCIATVSRSSDNESGMISHFAVVATKN